MKSVCIQLARWAAVAAAVLSLFLMFGNDPISSADANTVAEAVTQTLDMENMIPGDSKMIRRFYGLDPTAYESCILYYPTTNMMAEELLIVKLRDVSQQEAVKAAVEKRIQTQKNTFEGYGIEQFELLSKHAVVEVRGNFVLFVVSDASENALKAFLSAL